MGCCYNNILCVGHWNSVAGGGSSGHWNSVAGYWNSISLDLCGYWSSIAGGRCVAERSPVSAVVLTCVLVTSVNSSSSELGSRQRATCERNFLLVTGVLLCVAVFCGGTGSEGVFLRIGHSWSPDQWPAIPHLLQCEFFLASATLARLSSSDSSEGGGRN